MRQRSAGLLIFVIAIASFANIAIACTPPEIPSCFSSIGLTSSRTDYNFCRGQITYYQDYGKIYLDCLLTDLNQSVEEANRAAQNYQMSKSVFETARRNLNQAADRLNQANARHESQKRMYESNTQVIRRNLDAIINVFNAMFRG